MKLSQQLQNISDEFNKLTTDCEHFLSASSTAKDNLSNKLQLLLKDVYDTTKEEENFIPTKQALPQLIIEGFDLEQIWQQLELQNEEKLDKSVVTVGKLLAQKEQMVFEEFKSLMPETTEDNVDDEQKGNNDSGHDSDSGCEGNDSEARDEDESMVSGNERIQEEESEEEGSEHERVGDEESGNEKYVGADKFFNRKEMENFLQAQEMEKEEKVESDEDGESEESIDLFDENIGEENEDSDRLKNPRYKDFFGAAKDSEKKTKRNAFLEENELKSTFELREQRLQKKISEIEEKALSEKPWQLKGEISAEGRPQNSLLEEVVDFDVTSRPAPVITPETTKHLEDIIIQRIKDKAFDSVERKQKPVATPLEYKKKLMLDQEKSKESLAQIYEREYLKQKEALDPAAAEREEEEPALHKEVKSLMRSLFLKLDALSNFHFTPKPAIPELKIVTNLPAVNMEEVAPVATSDAALLAPEEVKKKPKGDLIGKMERSATDKKRERRKKKIKQRIRSKEQNKKNQNKEVSKGKTAKKTTSTNLETIKTSTAFFTKLQEEVKGHINQTSKRKNSTQRKVEAKKIKL